MKAFSPGGDVIGQSLVSTTALGDRSAAFEGKVNPSCATSPANGGVRTETASQLTVAEGSTFNWIFDITTVEGTAFTATPSIQVQYMGINPNNNMVQNQGITSEEISLITTVPEPSTLAILGVGLVGLGCLRRRKARGHQGKYVSAGCYSQVYQ